jgi:hypothetical protein
VGNKLFDVPQSKIALGAKMPNDRTNEIISAIKPVGINVRITRMKFLDKGYWVKPEWVT